MAAMKRDGRRSPRSTAITLLFTSLFSRSGSRTQQLGSSLPYNGVDDRRRRRFRVGFLSRASGAGILTSVNKAVSCDFPISKIANGFWQAA